MHNLTATAVKQAKSKIYKMFDGGGLHVKLKPCSAKYWRYDYRYRYMGTRKTLALGVYPKVSLKEARKWYHLTDSLKVQQGASKRLPTALMRMQRSQIKKTRNLIIKKAFYCD